MNVMQTIQSKAEARSRLWPDAVAPDLAYAVMRAAEEWIGPWARPAAVVLTHGHFDHVGSLRDLLQQWNVPVYASYPGAAIPDRTVTLPSS